MKKFISLFVAFAIAFNFICVQVAAEGEVTGGRIDGTNISWELLADGTLQFTVSGNITAFDSIPDFTPADGDNPPPWVHLKDSVTAISVYSGRIGVGSYAFYGFDKLTEIGTFFNFVTGNIGEYAFAGSGISGEINLISPSVGRGAFEGCPNLEKVTVRRQVTSAGDGIFKNSGLKSVELSDTALTTLSDSMFEGCANLIDVNVSKNLPNLTVGTQTFMGCTSLDNIDFLPSNTIAIGAYAFSGSGISTAKIPSSVTSMGVGVFENCPNLTVARMSAGLSEISDRMFSGDSLLTSVSIGTNITRIGNQAFASTGLTDVNIPYVDGNAVEIGEQAFLNCGGLTEVTLPLNVEKIGDGAFNSCVNLKALFIPKDVTLTDGGSNLVSPSTYKVTYEGDINATPPTAKIVSIESGSQAGSLVDVPTYIVINNETDEGLKLYVNEVDSGYHSLVSQNHSHIPDVSGNCTICGLQCGESRGTTWAVTDGDNTLIISAIETAASDIKGRMDNYKTEPDNKEQPWIKSGSVDYIKALEIREGVTYIGNNAFDGLTIPKIEIPSSVETIGQGAFGNITLTEDFTVFIPPTVNAVYSEAFKGSNPTLILYPNDSMYGNLPTGAEGTVRARYEVDGDIVNIVSVDKEGFTGTYQYPKTVIINGVEKRVVAKDCDHKFDGEYGLCTICEAVTGGNMGKASEDPATPANDNVTWYWSPDDSAVFISTKKNGDGSAVADADIKNYDTQDNKNPFYRLKTEMGASPSELVFDGGITSVGDYAFYDLDGVKAINIPSKVTEIGDSAFENCLSVTEITLPDGLLTIGSKAFFNISFSDPNAPNSLFFVDIPESVTTVGAEAFGNCNKLYYVAYPDGLSVDTAGIPAEVFKLKYRTLASDSTKVEVTEIIPGKVNALISMPETICGKAVVKVDNNYHDLVNKNSCKHTYLDKDTNTCPVCGQVLGNTGVLPEDEVGWRFDSFVEGYGNNVLTFFTNGSGYMHDYSKGENAPWHSVMENIRTVVIQEGVRNIGDYAFKGAKDLIEVVYPSTIEKIGAHAFENCVTYKNVIIPDSVTELGTDVFFDATDYMGMHNNPFITLRKDLYDQYKNVFFTADNKTQAVLLLYGDTADGRQITGAVLTNGFDRDRLQPYELNYPVSDGHNHCFNNNNICILCGTVGGNCGPDDDPTQTTWALNIETGHLSVTGDGEVAYHPWMDNYKDSVKDVLIGKGVVSICAEAFKDCVNLASVTFEAASVLSDIGGSAFAGCTALRNIELPANIKTIAAEAFSGSGLSGGVIIPSSIISIEKNSFANCPDLINLLIPDSFADRYKPNTPDIDLSSRNAAVLVYSNDGSSVLGICVPAGSTDVEVEIPSNIFPGVPVTNINGVYKGNVRNIKKVSVPDTVTYIADRAFEGFGSTDPSGSRVVEINIPQSVNHIGEAAFKDAAVQIVSLPAGVTVIPKSAFENCSLLESVVVSSSLTEIGELAFGACNSLKAVNTSNTPDVADFRGTALTTVADSAFAGCSALTKAVLPLTLENVISPTVFEGCTSLAILEIPEVNPSGADISYAVINAYDIPTNDTTTVIVYREIDNVPQITSAVFGNDDNWQNRIKNENDVIDDWLIVWKDHKHCFNKTRECVLCKQQGGKCGETATWVYDKNRYTIIINSKDGGDGVMWDMVESTDTASDDYIHYQEMWASLKDEIREVVINEGMTTIGRNAFKDCPNLTTVHIPSTLKTIGASAFESSSNLRVVYIADNSALESIETNAFRNCGMLKNIGAAETARLPQNLKYIRDGAFENCSSLPEIVLPDTVTTIGQRAFAKCVNLASAKLSLYLTSFGKEAFDGCTSLKEIVVPVGVSGGDSIFSNCDNLIFAVIPNSFAESNFTPNPVTLVKYALTDNTNLKSDRIITEVKPVPGTTVTIPDYIMGYPVTEIGSRAFKANTAFNQGNEPKVNLPSTLVTINDFAFEGCTWLKELILPDGLITIGTQAFEGCVGLTEMIIPDTVSELGMEAFHMCNKLETVTLSSGLREIKKGTFDGCAKLRYAVVPEGVTAIGEYAFRDCAELEYVVLPFTSRGGNLKLNAFDGCVGLAAIYAPTAVKIDYIDGADGEHSESVISTADAVSHKLRIAVYDQNKEVFKVIDGTSDNGRSTYETVLDYPVGFSVRENPPHFHCFNIHNQCILCGDRGGKCGPNAWWTLDEKGNLKIYTENGAESVIDHDSAEYFGTWTEFKDRIYTIEIGEGITLIDGGAFEHCLRLQSVTLPESLETVEDYAFSDCISLVSIDLPDGIINLGEGVFKDDINLKNVELPKSISELKKDTFKGCRTLETIKLPADLRYVREGAFSGCINLTSIELPVDTRTVSEDAFSDCTNLTYIVAPDGCRYTFDEDEFPNATYFKYAPEGVGVRITYARPGANVHHLVIPTEIAGLPVVAIGDGAFTRADSRNFMALSEDAQAQQGLVTVTIPENSLLTEIGNNAFKDRTDLQELIVKNNKIVSIGKSAFEGCTSLEKAGLPSSVQRIGDRAFFGCGKLKNIPIYEGLLSIGTEAFANCGFDKAFVIIPSTVSEMGTSVFGNIADNALIAIPQTLAKRYDNSHTGNTGSYDFRKDNCGYVVYRVDGNGNKWVTEGKLGNGQNAVTGFESYMKIASDHVHCLYKGFCVLCNFAGGNCGSEEDINGNSNATWYIDRETRTLHITGTGKMKDYTGSDVAPWLEWNDFIANIEVHEGITGISANAFMNCEKVTNVKLPLTLKNLGSNAFVGNTSLASVTVPEGVKTIPVNAFKDCGQLKNVNLPKSVENIEAGAFAGCNSLKYVELPAAGHNISIDKTAFEDSLDYIAIPEGTVIKAETASYNRFTYRLDNESALRIVKAQLGNNRELKFPASIGGIPVKAIGGYGQGNVISGNEVKDIRIVSIPEGVTEIYDEAFAGCENLFSLTLPNSLETIGKKAFSGCGGIKELIFKNSLKSIGEYAFSDCGALETVKLPLGIEKIGNYAFSECGKLDIILTPRNVIDNRGYTQTASLVYYERRADGRDYIAAARLGEGKTNINVGKIEDLGVYLDIDNHEHCYNEGVCVLCNDDGGLCGVGVVWKLNGDTLEIKLREGLTSTEADTGEMYDYSPSNPAPWKKEHKDVIKKLVIRDGVKSVGAYAFSGLAVLSDVSEAFPVSLAEIGERAFENCISLAGNSENGSTLILDENIRKVASNAFAGCTTLKKIILSDSTSAALTVPEDTAVLKYRFIDSSSVKITKIEISEGKTVDVPNVILNHQVVEVAKEYRKYVNTDTHIHYHNEGERRCTICDIISGECGDKVTWYIDEKNKRLVIEGEGEMYDYNVDSGKNAPWTQYADLIDAIFIKEGVTYIGDNAFVDMGSFDEITLPPGIRSVGDNVFAGSKIRRMYIPSGLKSDLFGKDIEKITYKINEDKKWVDVTRIDLPDGKTKISLPKTIYGLPIRSVEKEFRKYVDQNDGHVHDYGEEHGESECRICGKVSYNHIWEDGWNSDDNSHWHDCERGDYDPIKDGDLDGSGYGDHDWVDTGEKRDGKTVYRCSVCGREKLVGSSVDPGPGPDDPKPPVTGDNNGSGNFAPPTTTSGNGGTTKPPVPGDDSGGNNGGTTTPPQPWETEATEKPPITNPPSDNIPDESDFNGKYGFEVEKGDNSLNASIADSTSSLIKAVLNEEERDKLINGTSEVRIILSVTEGDGTVSLRDRAIISAALGEYKLGEYLDISLFKVVDGVRERITHTSAPITITIDIPNSLKNSGRRFRVIRSHDGSAAVLRDLDNSADTVTISTDRFSPYAIAYTDSVNVSDDYDPPMPTGDPGISVFIFVTMASGLTAVGMIYFNHASDVEVEEERKKKIAKLVAFGKKGKLQKYIAISLIFLVTLYYQGIEGIQRNRGQKADI